MYLYNCWNRFGIEYEVWDIVLFHFFSCGQQLKITKLPTRENFGPAKYPQEKVSDARNTHEKKFWTHEIPTRKNFRPMKYPREKKFENI